MLAVALPALRREVDPGRRDRGPDRTRARAIVSDAIQRDFGGAGATPVTVAIAAGLGRRAPSTRSPTRIGALDGVARSPRRPTSAATPGV